MNDNVTPLPRAHEGPRRSRFAAGRANKHGVVIFPTVSPDPDRDLASDRIEPGWGNGVIDSFRAKLPTPPDEYDLAFAASTLSCIASELAKVSENLRRFAETLYPPESA